MKEYKTLNEEIQKMKYLSSYKKGSVIKEDTSEDCFNKSESCKKMKTHLMLSDYPKDRLNEEMVECFKSVDDETKKCIQSHIESKYPKVLDMVTNILGNLWDDFTDWLGD